MKSNYGMWQQADNYWRSRRTRRKLGWGFRPTDGTCLSPAQVKEGQAQSPRGNWNTGVVCTRCADCEAKFLKSPLQQTVGALLPSAEITRLRFGTSSTNAWS